jgi:hypothetical protein
MDYEEAGRPAMAAQPTVPPPMEGTSDSAESNKSRGEKARRKKGVFLLYAPIPTG